MKPPLLKCVIWDLDETLWAGTLREGDTVRVQDETFVTIRRLEAAGIVQSIVSKNDGADATRMLETLGLLDIFVYPQISWSAKSALIGQIVECLNIRADAVAFIDDSAFERAEVVSRWPEVRCFALPDFLQADDYAAIVTRNVTGEAARRPQAYREESRRRKAEKAFTGTSVEFLSSIGMVLTIRNAQVEDFPRAAELTQRTNQLNTTGIEFSAEEFAVLSRDLDTLVIVAELTDRFGDYGRVGLCVVSLQPDVWFLDLLLLSCRVSGRNIIRALLGTLGAEAASRSLVLRGRYRATGRNRQMQITYALLGFTPVASNAGEIIYEHRTPGNITVPPYVSIVCDLPSIAACDPLEAGFSSFHRSDA